MLKRPLRVLIVEDNPGDALLLQHALMPDNGDDFELEVEATLHNGLRRLGDGFDVAIFDLTLPDSYPQPLDFLDHAQRIAPGTPIIVVTGHDDLETATRSLRRGAQDYLIKGQADGPMLVRSIRYAIERQHTDERLRESEQRYALAVRGANDGLWDWHIESGKVYYSERWKGILGLAPEHELSSIDDWLDRIHPRDRHLVDSALSSHLAGTTEHFEAEYRIRHEESHHVWALTRGIAIGDGSEPTRMAGSMTDITSRKEVEEQLVHAALHDSLTGLPNRALFVDRLRVAINQAKRRSDYIFAVLFLDLDRFKTINDSLGHPVGDQLLISIAHRLESLLRPSDRVARLGGDEFAILTDDLEDVSDATRVAERLLHELEIPYGLQGNEVYSSASIGITTSLSAYDDPQDMLRDADTAMYRAKSLGRSRYQLFDPDMHLRAVEQLALETDLRRALERQEFLVHYQPIVKLSDGGIEGFEALVRWQHPERGLLHPEDFVPLAEETGLILQIGRHVLESACEQVADWQQRLRGSRPLPTISVNVSGREFLQQDLVDRVQDVLNRSSLSPGSLRLEITESMIMDNADAAIDKLKQLRELMVQLHLDDFGTGYSSLSYLHRLPTDTLKIDRSFVSKVDSQGQGTEIISTIVALARKLGMDVSAEGLETRQQVDRVRSLACDFGQGYYFSEPLDAANAENLLMRGHQLMRN